MVTRLRVVLLLGTCIIVGGQETRYEINGVDIPKKPIRIEHKRTIKSKQTESVPALQEDLLTLGTGIANMRVTYTRYRNASLGFSGNHPSLMSSSMGLDIGVSPEPWHWHYADSTRIFLDEQDIFASHEATGMNWREGFDFGRVRFFWETPEANITLHLAIPGNRLVAYVEYLVEPRGTVRSIDIRLRCFPGAYESGPTGGPSHRWVSTPSHSVEVRRGEPSRKLNFTDEDGWVFYADKYHDYRYGRGFGPVGLILAADNAGVTGEVNVTDYGLDTTLHCKPDCRRVRFAMHAFTFFPNHHALQTLKKRLKLDRETLATLPFWEQGNENYRFPP